MDAFNIGRFARKPLPNPPHTARNTQPHAACFGAAFLAFALLYRSASAAQPDQTYSVTGKDSFSIGAGVIQSDVSYEGTETLTVRPHGKNVRYSAHVLYARSDAAATTDTKSDFISDMSPAGDVVDSANHDPDYLTVLNQPFAAQLDRQTLDDLRHLHGTLPFDFPSPFTGSSLHGYLRHTDPGGLGSRRAIGVKFEAAGPMAGELPDRPGLRMTGTITMRGTAFYDLERALLLTLDTTVTISGIVSNRTTKDPVTITYSRTIRAHDPAKVESGRTSP